jgi:signal transduction protein with GAF and PtsI domain
MEQHTPGSRLYDLTAFLEQQSSLDECLTELAVMSARVLNTQNCSIMLIKKDSGEIALRVFAHSGYLPDRAHQEAVKIKQGVSGYVASTDKSDFAPLKRGRYKSRGFIAAPIKLHDTVVGVINANTPIGRRNIDRRDLELLIVIALLIGKTIEVNQLQNLLQSQYVQHALAEPGEDSQNTGQDLLCRDV